MKAIEHNEWDRITQLHEKWQKSMAECLPLLQTAPADEASVRLLHLLEDIQHKSHVLEQAIAALQQQQQQELRQLKQAQSYLSPL